MNANNKQAALPLVDNFEATVVDLLGRIALALESSVIAVSGEHIKTQPQPRKIKGNASDVTRYFPTREEAEAIVSRQIAAVRELRGIEISSFTIMAALRKACAAVPAGASIKWLMSDDLCARLRIAHASRFTYTVLE